MLEIDLEAPWPSSDWADIAARAFDAARQVETVLANPRLETSVLFTSDAHIHELNREWRQRDKPTNVLSFPMIGPDRLLALTHDGPPELLGDIAIAFETCRYEASEKGIPIEHHTAHLLIHGLLHLAGHDHVESNEQADVMEGLEIKALALMGIPDPYGDRN